MSEYKCAKDVHTLITLNAETNTLRCECGEHEISLADFNELPLIP